MNNILKLKDVCDINGGYAFKSTSFVQDGIPLIRIGDISNNKVNITDGTVYINDDINKYDKYIIKKGDILIALSGATTGKFGIYDKEDVALLNQRVAKIVPKEGIVNRYLYHYMNKLQEIIYNNALGCAQPNISPSEISELSIYIPETKKQELIVKILDKTQELIDKRKTQIESLDELIKSRFIELCANGSSDYESWDKIRIEDIAEQRKGAMRTGPFGSSLLHSEFVDEGIFVLGIDNAVENYFTWNKMRYITEEKYEQLKNYTVFPGDVIITIMGTVGRSVVIPSNFPKAINTKHLACITLNKLIANPYFISYCIHEHPYVIQQLRNQSKGAIMDGLNLTIIKSIKIPLPPIEIQESFVNFMKQVDKLKFEMEKSLKELEDNFNSLMQKAFNGELFN